MIRPSITSPIGHYINFLWDKIDRLEGSLVPGAQVDKTVRGSFVRPDDVFPSTGGGKIQFKGQYDPTKTYSQNDIVIREKGKTKSSDTSEIDTAVAGTYLASSAVNPGDLAPGVSADDGAMLGVSIGGGVITGINVINGGSNYTGTVTVQITGDGSGATAHATISNGIVTAVTVDNGGSGYTGATATIVNAQKWVDLALFSTQRWVLLIGQQKVTIDVGRDSSDDLQIRIDKDKDKESSGSVQINMKDVLSIPNAGNLVIKFRETIATDENCIEKKCIVLRSDFY